METLNPNKLTVKFIGTDQGKIGQNRKYTLIHSDVTGDLFLSIGNQYDNDALKELYSKLMRDEVLAEIQWSEVDQPEFHVHCHVSGGIVLGGAAWRYAIFQKNMHQVLQAFRHGDREYIDSDPLVREANVIIHFHSSNPKYNRVENWGSLDEYKIRGHEHASA